MVATETTQQSKHLSGQEGDEGATSSHDRSGESQKEARIRKPPILTAKAHTRTGTLNVRTLYSTGKLAIHESNWCRSMRQPTLPAIG
jgi:hypothetical protein